MYNYLYLNMCSNVNIRGKDTIVGRKNVFVQFTRSFNLKYSAKIRYNLDKYNTGHKRFKKI